MAAKAMDKLIDEIGGLTVIELSELVKALEDKFGVSAAMPAAAAPVAAAGGAEAAEAKTEFKVTLQSAGEKKVAVIKAVKQATGWGLGDAKKAVEGAPAVIVEGVSKEDAEKVKKALEEAGAQVELS